METKAGLQQPAPAPRAGRKMTGVQVLVWGTLITAIIVLLGTFLIDVGLPRVTWFMELAGRTALVVFGVLYAFWYEEGDEWWVL